MIEKNLVPLALKKYAIIYIETYLEFILFYSCSSCKLFKLDNVFPNGKYSEKFFHFTTGSMEK